MNLDECYSALKGNYAEARGRLMNDKLVIRFILKFLSDPSMEELRAGVAANDNELAFRAVHTLKGVAANLAFTELYNDASALTEQMRSLKNSADPQLLAKLEETYTNVIDVLKRFEQEQA